jgi:hypothetical protein
MTNPSSKSLAVSGLALFQRPESRRPRNHQDVARTALSVTAALDAALALTEETAHLFAMCDPEREENRSDETEEEQEEEEHAKQ